MSFNSLHEKHINDPSGNGTSAILVMPVDVVEGPVSQ